MALTAFNLNKNGSGQVGAELWIDLGLIPTGFDEWIGNVQYSTGKATTFELRTNTLTKTSAVLADTLLLSSVALTARSGTLTTDLYKKGTLHIKTVVGTGVEHWYLRMTSKSSTLGNYLYSINYVQE